MLGISVGGSPRPESANKPPETRSKLDALKDALMVFVDRVSGCADQTEKL